MELAGFPHHSLDNYLPRLVRAGYRVAICDQLEDPKMVKGIVKRGVTELVTPGVSYNEKVLENKRNNFLAAVHFSGEQTGICFLDVSTGEFLIAQGNKDYADKLEIKIMPTNCFKAFNQVKCSIKSNFTRCFRKNSATDFTPTEWKIGCLLPFCK